MLLGCNNCAERDPQSGIQLGFEPKTFWLLVLVTHSVSHCMGPLGRRGGLWAEEGASGQKRRPLGRRGGLWAEEEASGQKKGPLGRRGGLWAEEGASGQKRGPLGRGGGLWAEEEPSGQKRRPLGRRGGLSLIWTDSHYANTIAGSWKFLKILFIFQIFVTTAIQYVFFPTVPSNYLSWHLGKISGAIWSCEIWCCSRPCWNQGKILIDGFPRNLFAPLHIWYLASLPGSPVSAWEPSAIAVLVDDFLDSTD